MFYVFQSIVAKEVIDCREVLTVSVVADSWLVLTTDFIVNVMFSLVLIKGFHIAVFLKAAYIVAYAHETMVSDYTYGFLNLHKYNVSTMTALPNKCYSGHHKATEKEDDQKNTWKRDLERETWTAGFRFSWRKMETAAQDRAGWRRVVYGLCSTGIDKA